MNRRAAITKARELLRKRAAQSAPETTYDFGDRTFVLHAPDEDYILRLASEWKPKDMELEQQGDA